MPHRPVHGRLRGPASAGLVAGLVALALACAGCRGDGSGSDDEDPAAASSSLSPASASAPAGTTRVTCELATDAGPLRVALDLPTGFQVGATRHRPDDSADCVWRHPERVRPAGGPGYTAVVRVSIGYVRGGDRWQTLSEVHDAEQVNAVEPGEPQDDDSILDLRLDRGVPALGEAVGDRLSFGCRCDGQDTITRYAQAAGVRVQWSSVRELEQQTDAQLAAALAGAGTVP